MTFAEQRPRPRTALLVLALLVGLLGMHGLAPDGVQRPSPIHHAQAEPATHSGGPAAGGPCHGGRGSPHDTEHADPTCASGAVSHSPVLPALSVSPYVEAAAAAPLSVRLAYGQPYEGRAPPTLEQLQLLRI